jgi:hypothetical protein
MGLNAVVRACNVVRINEKHAECDSKAAGQSLGLIRLACEFLLLVTAQYGRH